MQNAERRMQNAEFIRFTYLGSGPSSGGGDDGIRTHDPLLAGQVLSQLSYTPILLPSAVILLRSDMPLAWVFAVSP